MLPELNLVGIALSPIIVAIIGLAKRYGLPTHYAPLVNALLSLAGYATIVAVTQGWADPDAVAYVLNALIIFLAAAGIYDRYQATVRQARSS